MVVIAGKYAETSGATLRYSYTQNEESNGRSTCLAQFVEAWSMLDVTVSTAPDRALFSMARLAYQSPPHLGEFESAVF